MPQAFVDIKVTGNDKTTKYRLESDLDGKVTLSGFLKFTQTALLNIALEEFNEDKARGFDPNPIVVTDGVRGKPPGNVHPLGKIEFISRQTSQDILLPIYEQIIARSRKDTGLYERSNLVAINGLVVASNLGEFKNYLAGDPNIKPGSKVRFFNITPYARKLELAGISKGNSRGKTAVVTRRKSKKHRPRKVTVRVPNGAYHITYQKIKGKFGKNANIVFEFVPGNNLGIDKYVIKNPHTGKAMRRTFSEKRRKGGGRPYLYPTIIVTIDKSGTKEVLQ